MQVDLLEQQAELLEDQLQELVDEVFRKPHLPQDIHYWRTLLTDKVILGCAALPEGEELKDGWWEVHDLLPGDAIELLKFDGQRGAIKVVLQPGEKFRLFAMADLGEQT